MGQGIILKCSNCDEEFDLNFGVGMGYPESVRITRQDALDGGLGEEWRKIIIENPYYVIGPRECLYWCPKCHCFEMTEDLSIYKPKNLESILKEKRGEKTVAEWGYDPWGSDDENYELYKEFVKECPNCNTKMERKELEEVEKIELVCPECGHKLIDTGMRSIWD